jgi:tape measure domain-containing protein
MAALQAGSLEIKLFADLARLQSDMNKANKTVDTAMNNIDKSVRVAKNAFASLAGAFSIGAVIKMVDEYKKFDAQIKLSTRSLNEYNNAYANVIRIGRTAQSDIGAIGVLYARLTNNLRDFGTSQKEIANITESVALSLRVSNATVQETNSVMLQLSQSFGSGRINGQEFLAVSEGAPIIMRQLAKSIGVTYGELKELSAQGKLTSDTLAKALNDPSYLAGLREQVKEVGTISSALTVLQNNIKQFLGEADKANGASKAFANSLIFLGDNLAFIANVAIAAGVVQFVKYTQGLYANVVATNQSRAATIIAAQAKLSLAQAAYNSGVAINTQTKALAGNAAATTLATSNTARLIAAQTALARTTSIATIAAQKLGAAINLMGGWIGLAVTALILFGDKIYGFVKSVNGITPMLEQIRAKAKEMNEELGRTPQAIATGAASNLEELGKQRDLLDKKLAADKKALADIERSKKLGFGGDPMREMLLGSSISQTQKDLATSLALYQDFVNQKVEAEKNAAASSRGYTKQQIDASNELLDKIKSQANLRKEYEAEVKAIKEAGKIAGSDVSGELAKLKEDYDKATGAAKAYKEENKLALQTLQEQIEEEMRLVDEAGKAYAEFRQAQLDATNEVILAAVSENEQIENQIKKTQENIELLNIGEDAQNRMAEARLLDAINTSEQIIAQGKLNGLSGEALKYAEDYLFVLKERLELQQKLTKTEEEENRIKAIKEAEKERVKAAKDANNEIEAANDRLYKNLSRSITDSIVRGFEDGLSFIDNFKRAITTAFKSFFVNIGVNYVQKGLEGVFGNSTKGIFGGIASIFSGNAMAGNGVAASGMLDQAKGVFDVVTKGVDGAGMAFTESVGNFGNYISSFGQAGGGLDSFGKLIANNNSLIAQGLSFTDAAIKLVSGDVKGAAFSGGGAGLGLLLSGGNPLGGAIGSFIGSSIGGLFGGKKQPPRTVTQLPQVSEQFNAQLSTLLGGFGLANNVSSNTSYKGRGGGSGYGTFQTNINGMSNTLYTKDAGAYSQASLDAFVKRVLTVELVNAIKRSDISAGIKTLFDGLTDQTQISNMIQATIALNNANQGLSDRFGLTANNAAILAKQSGLAGDELVNFVAALAQAAGAFKTPAQQLIEFRDKLTKDLGMALPATLDAFDAILKSFDTTTTAGRDLFLSMFNLRDEFSQFTASLDAIKKGVGDSIFGLLSPAQQQAMNQARLSEEFAKFNLAVPNSVQQLIAIGQGIDYTTEAGLNLALAFPTLVQAFQATQGAVDALANSLNPDRFRTFFDFAVASSYSRQGLSIPAANMPSYAVGTSYVPNDGVAMLHQGEAVLTKSQNTDMTMNSGKVVSLLEALVNRVGELEYDMRRAADGTQRTARELEDLTSGDVTITTQAA